MRSWLLGLVLVVVTFLAYQPAWRGDAVFDDDDHLTSPEFASFHGLVRIWTEPGAVSQYYPVTHTAFWLQNRLWGHAMPGYHFTNLALHVLCAFLFFRILQRLALPGAWLAAAIFALHPVHAESVAWISELKNTLSTAFYLGAALAWLRFDQDRRCTDYFIALVLFILALLSKSVTASLPAALLVVLWWQRGRLSPQRDVFPLLPFFLLGIGSGLFTAWIERRFIGAEGADFDLGTIQRLLIAGRAFWFYLGKLFWPANLTFIYPRWNLNEASVWQFLFPVAAVLLVAGLWILRTRRRGPLATTLLFAGTLFPALGFLNVYPFRYSFVADHYVYLASLGFIAAVSSVFATLLRHWLPFNAAVPRTLSFVLLVALATTTWHQSHIYRNTETIWRDTLAKNPSCFVAHSNLGLHLHQRGQLAEAIFHLQKARQLQPAFAEIHNNLGNALRDQGRLDEARALYQQALQIRPNLAQAHYNLGALLLIQHQSAEALPHFQKAVELRPEYVDAHVNLAGLLLDQNRPADALPHARHALSLRPENPDALTNYASALLALNRPAEAFPLFEKALAQQPDSAPRHFNLAQALLALNRTAKAQSHLERAIALDPTFGRAQTALGHLLLAAHDPAGAIRAYQSAIANNPAELDAACNLAWLLATASNDTLRDGPQALRLATAVNNHFSGRNNQVLQILAAALAETGQYTQAADTLRPVIATTDRQLLADLLQAQLAAYEAERPWRTTP
ncbi:MAG: tetratricopeptide repeat protein [Nibricoccus sp.]